MTSQICPLAVLTALIVMVKNHKFVLAVTSDSFYPTGPLTSQSLLIKIVIIPTGAGAKEEGEDILENKNCFSQRILFFVKRDTKILTEHICF